MALVGLQEQELLVQLGHLDQVARQALPGQVLLVLRALADHPGHQDQLGQAPQDQVDRLARVDHLEPVLRGQAAQVDHLALLVVGRQVLVGHPVHLVQQVLVVLGQAVLPALVALLDLEFQDRLDQVDHLE